MYRKFLKRLLDIIFALTGLPFLMLLICVFAPLIYVEDKGKVFYTSNRRGMNGKIYRMYKFRTMKMNAPDVRNNDGSTFNDSNDPRLTKIGKFIRRTSLDEVPQIINIMIGDMSFIGPRPTLTDKALEDYDEALKKRIMVRPGITGYSQAFFRNSITQDQKYEYDKYYVENLNFILDVKILIKTLSSVLKRENIYNGKSSL